MAYDFDKARAEQAEKNYEEPTLAGIFTAKSLGDLNMEQELVAQFNLVRQMQSQVMLDVDVPANQRAQVANAVASTIKQLVETQERYYSQERFKRIESLLIRTLKTWPVEQAKEFIDEFERILES